VIEEPIEEKILFVTKEIKVQKPVEKQFEVPTDNSSGDEAE
jgi:hypothetical protein